MNTCAGKLNLKSGVISSDNLWRYVFFKKLIIIITCLGLSSCGFHLRGTNQNNINAGQNLSVYIGFSSDDSLFERQLKNDLKLAKVTLVKDASQVDNHLIIVNSLIEKKAIGFDSTGRNNEFEISYAVDFVINNKANLEIKTLNTTKSNSQIFELERKTIITRQSLYIDRSDPIGKRVEEKKMLESMRQDISNKLVRQFISVTNYALKQRN